MKQLIVMVLSILVAAACVHTNPMQGRSIATSPVDHSRMVFKVGSAQNHHILSGVAVNIIGRDGTVTPLGQTDSLGSLAVPKVTLSEHHARFVLFSHEHFFAGVIVVESPGLNFYEYDEKYIELAPFALI